MKNLPEKDFWNALRVRLNNYSEMPDDDGWDRIAGALPKSKSTSQGKRWAGIVLIFLLGTSTGYLLHQYAPFSGETNASVVNVISEEAENFADKTSVSDADSQEDGKSGQTALVENSATVDQEGSKYSAETESVREANTDRPTSLLKETRDRQANRNVKVTEQKVGAANFTEADANHGDSNFENGKSGMSDFSQIRSDQGTNSSSARGEGSEEAGLRAHTAATSAAHESPATTGDNVSNTSNREASVAGADKAEGRSSVVNSGQPGSGQSRGEIAKSEETTSAGRTNGKAETGAGENSVQHDSSIVAKQEVVEKITSGQSEKKELKQKKEKRIFHADVYANLTPSLSFQKITPSGNDDLRIIGLQSNGVMSGDRFGLSFEAGVQRKITSRLDFYAGLSYYRQKQMLTYEYNGSGVNVEQGGTNGQYSITPLKESKSFQYNMTNAGISSGVMYHLFGDKLMHKIGGGFQFQKGLLRMGSESSYNNVASFYFNYQLSYRLECQLNSKWNVYLQPTFIHSIVSHEELTEPFTIKPYRAGLGIGAIYHF